MRPRQKLGIGIAEAYWLFLVGLYLYIPFGDPGYQYGGIGLILDTLPWGLIGQFGTVIGAIAPNQIGEAVAFLVLVVVCGGANAYIIMRLFGYRLGRRQMKAIAGIGCGLAIAVQFSAGPRERAARNYHWPLKVPRSAFLVPNWSQEAGIRIAITGKKLSGTIAGSGTLEERFYTTRNSYLTMLAMPLRQIS